MRKTPNTLSRLACLFSAAALGVALGPSLCQGQGPPAGGPVSEGSSNTAKAPKARSAAGARAETLRVGSSKPSRRLALEMERKGKTPDLNRLLASLRDKSSAALAEQGKFEVLSPLNLAVAEMTPATGGPATSSTPPAEPVRPASVQEADYLAGIEIDRFQVTSEEVPFQNGSRGIRRHLLLAGTVSLWRASSHELIDASDLTLQTNVLTMLEPSVQTNADWDLRPHLNLEAEFARAAAIRMVDALFPIQVTGREARVVTIDRGKNAGLQVGDVLVGYGPARTTEDPVAHRKFRVAGGKTARIRVSEVSARAARCEVLEEQQDGKSLREGSVLSRQQGTAGR